MFAPAQEFSRTQLMAMRENAREAATRTTGQTKAQYRALMSTHTRNLIPGSSINRLKGSTP